MNLSPNFPFILKHNLFPKYILLAAFSKQPWTPNKSISRLICNHCLQSTIVSRMFSQLLLPSSVPPFYIGIQYLIVSFMKNFAFIFVHFHCVTFGPFFWPIMVVFNFFLVFWSICHPSNFVSFAYLISISSISPKTEMQILESIVLNHWVSQLIPYSTLIKKILMISFDIVCKSAVNLSTCYPWYI